MSRMKSKEHFVSGFDYDIIIMRMCKKDNYERSVNDEKTSICFNCVTLFSINWM